MSAGKDSKGLLMYRVRDHVLEVLLAHPGGPFFASKDQGVWTIPKGEPAPGEDGLAAAKREFEEETGLPPPAARFIPLGDVHQRGGKRVEAWAFEGEWGDRQLVCNTFELEWPPRSGRMQRFPEVDRVQFFAIDEARRRINPAQVAFLERLASELKAGAP